MNFIKEILAWLLAPSLIFNFYQFFDRKKLRAWEAKRDIEIKKAELEKIKRKNYLIMAKKLTGQYLESPIDLQFEKEKLEAEIKHLEKLAN